MPVKKKINPSNFSFFFLGPKAVEAYSQKFQVRTLNGELLFSADDNEVVVGAKRLKVLGKQCLTKLFFPPHDRFAYSLIGVCFLLWCLSKTSSLALGIA